MYTKMHDFLLRHPHKKVACKRKIRIFRYFPYTALSLSPCLYVYSVWRNSIQKRPKQTCFPLCILTYFSLLTRPHTGHVFIFIILHSCSMSTVYSFSIFSTVIHWVMRPYYKTKHILSFHDVLQHSRERNELIFFHFHAHNGARVVCPKLKKKTGRSSKILMR